MSKIIKGFKAYDKGLICKGFKYEVGKEYSQDEKPNICNSGFHFCENPLDTLNYYNLTDCEFTEVEAIGNIDKLKEKNSDSKLATDKIIIGAKLNLSGFIKASFDFLWYNCNKKSKSDKDSKSASGDDSKLAASGNYSQLAASGYNSKLAASGNDSQLAASGNDSKLAASGYNSKLAASGNYSQLAASGNDSKLAASGYNSQLAASGNDSQLAASGNYSKLEINGENSVGANIGINGIIKGKKGNWITLAEYKYDDNKNRYKTVCVLSAIIDGKKIKEDTWYKLVNNKFKEIK